MRNALGLMLASVVAAVVIAGVWFFATSLPRADRPPPQTMAARSGRARCRQPRPSSRPRILGQGRRRGHRRAVGGQARAAAASRAVPPKVRPAPIRTRSASAAWSRSTPRAGRASASSISSSSISSSRQGSRADLRRRPVAGQHACGAEGAGRRMHQGAVFPDRQARDLSSGDPEAGSRRRPHRRRAHLVARQSEQQEDDGAAGQGRGREGFQRGEDGARHRPRRRSSVSRSCSTIRRR